MERGLIITAIGMGLVFVLIILLWFIMALLVKVTENFKSGEEEDEAPEETGTQEEVAALPGQDKARLAAAMAAAAVIAQMRKNKRQVRRSISRSAAVPGTPSNNWLNAGRVRQILERKGR